MSNMHRLQSAARDRAELSRLRASNAELREALDGTLGLLRKAQDILSLHLQPDSPQDDGECLNALYGLLDGPEQRAIEKPARAAIAKSKEG